MLYDEEIKTEFWLADHFPYVEFEGFKPVLSKRDFAIRYKAGEFGNASPTWDRVDDFVRSGYNQGLVHLRNRVAGGPTYYDVAPNDVDLYLTQAIEDGVQLKDLYVSAMAPTEKTLIQGEVIQDSNGLYLYYSRVKKPMRDSLREGGREARGLLASNLLKTYLCSNSFEWLNVLLERYKLHVIEFSTYSTRWGTLPNYNTVFWEVRLY